MLVYIMSVSANFQIDNGVFFSFTEKKSVGSCSLCKFNVDSVEVMNVYELSRNAKTGAEYNNNMISSY
jgi:hypothetical protein